MLLQPRQPKYSRSYCRRKNTQIKNKESTLTVGSFSINVVDSARVSSKQLDAVRKTLRRSLTKKTKILLKVFPNVAVTKKPNETRLGKGKGAVKYWVFLARSGEQLFEVKGYAASSKTKAIKSTSSRLACKTYLFEKATRWSL